MSDPARELSDESDFFSVIRRKDYDRSRFVKLALTQPVYCQLIVDGMVGSKEIMVYYHCFEILKEATLFCPGRFFEYFKTFHQLLNHENSYHRDFGLILISNLIAGIASLDFNDVSDDYFACLNDPKFMTAECCLMNLVQILNSRPEYTASIMDQVLKEDNFDSFKEKQRELIYSHILNLMEPAHQNGFDRGRIEEFIKACRNSISPKTRKIAARLYKELIS